jgi:hypothetical protein
MRSLISIFSLVFLTGNLWADVPQQLHYQGYLTNAVGEQIDCPDPVQCAEQYDIRFRIYDSEVSGVVLWEETHGDIAIFLGSFHALLGQAEPIHGELMAGPRWLAISINGAPDLSPRQKMVSAAYALRANVADNATTAINATQLGGIDAGDFALTANVDAEDNDTLAALPCVDGEFAQMVAGVWTCVSNAPGIPTSMPGPCNEANAGVMYLDAASGVVWICDGSIYNKLKYCSGLCADPSTLPCGTPIVDDCGDACSATGTGLNLAACPDPTTISCGVVVEDGCGNSCGVTGQAPNASLCADPATVACGEVISDSCGHSCGTTGTASNATSCPGSESVACGQPVLDDCGNSCGANGTGLNVSTCGDPTTLTCNTPMQDSCGNDCGFSGSFCEGDVTCTATGCGPCLDDWLVGTPCNGVNYGNGCSPEQTGYHFVGVFNNGDQQWACWWHQKNQAWNTTPATNLYNLGLHFGLTNFNGGVTLCHHKTVNPCSVGACEDNAGSYFNSGQTGAWGWCAESDPNNGGFACFPDPGIGACP